MILNEKEKEFLEDSINFEICVLKSILKNKAMYQPETIVQIEHGFNVLSSALQHLSNSYIIDFNEEQSCHSRHAIALLLSELVDRLRVGEYLTDETHDLFKYQVNALIDLYKKLQ